MENRIGVISCHFSFASIRQAFQKTQSLGLGAIEWFESSDLEYRDPGISAQIRTLSEEYDIVPDYHAPYQEPWDIGRLSPEKMAEFLQEVVAQTKRLGGTRATVHMGSHPIGIAREEVIENVAMAFADVADADVQLCTENSTTCYQQTELGVTTDDFVRFFEIIGDKSVGWTFDVGHANVTGNLVELLEHFGDRLQGTHLHDTDGTSDGHLPPGKGTIDWDNLFATLTQMHYNGPLNLEFPESSNAFPEFIRMIRNA
jgi:sugar phosphate isomerase/epimerase